MLRFMVQCCNPAETGHPPSDAEKKSHEDNQGVVNLGCHTLELLDDLLLDVLWHRLVLLKLHAVLSASLGHGPQGRDVLEHLTAGT